jgi:hypothetical protein
MQDLIQLSKTKSVWKSLATLKPKEIVKFEVQEDERDWKPAMREGLRQMSLFASSGAHSGRELQIVRKLPYKYYYHPMCDFKKTPNHLNEEVDAQVAS